MKNIILGVVVLTLLTIGCRKSGSFLPQDWPDESLPHYSMDDEFKAYFQPGNHGSEYFYIDTVIGALDTTQINNIDEVLGSVGDPYTGEGYNISFVSTVTSNFRARLRTNNSYSYYQHIYSLGSGCNV